MSRFQIGDQIRHRTGTKLYLVLEEPGSGVYSLSGFGDGGKYSTIACNVVDENFILYERRIQDEIITEDPQRVMQWRDEVPCGQDYRVHMPRGLRKTWYIKPLGGPLAKSAKIQRFAEGYGGPVIPFKIDRALKLPDDVAVTLEGIPQGYYLRAFRVAGPADLIIKTNGVVCKEDCNYRGSKDLLLRPIIAKIPSAKPNVPGIPEGFELVCVGTPQPGNLFIDPIGGVAECMKPSPTSFRPIVRKKVSPVPCNGILPGIPLGFTVVRFGDVSPEEFYFDTVGTLKQGPSKNRLVLKKVELPISIPPWMKGPVFKGPVDWGVVDRKVRNDAADAAAYAVSQLKSACDTIKAEESAGAFTEREFMNVKSRTTVWTTAADSMMQGTHFIPTGRSRKVKVI